MTLPVALPSPVPARPRRVRRPAASSSPSPRRKTLPFPQVAPGEDGVVGLTSWETYLRLDEHFAVPGFRLRYLRGVIEIMSTSRLHELLKENLADFIKAFCGHKGIEYSSYGHATQKRHGESAGDPDGSFIFGTEDKERPDLIIEIALSSGGIGKLDFWATMKISEVWVWQDDALHAFVYDQGQYKQVTDSRWLPGIDFALMQELAPQRSSTALREFRARMRQGQDQP